MKTILKFLFKLFLAIAAIIAIFVVAVNYNVFGHLYTIKEIKSFTNENASLIYSEDNVLIGKIFAEDRTNVTFEEFPDHLINALVATEDARYFEHEGIDSQSLLRVLFKSIILGDDRSGGGSTITQQLAKNMYGRHDFGFMTMPINKTKEALLARRIESIYDKQEILTLYLNTVPFGENVFGIESASRRFFNKKVSKLSVTESAVLIGLLKANTAYNPRLYPERSMHRRNVVLSQMNKYGYLSDEDLSKMKEQPLNLDYENLASMGIANYFLVDVKKQSMEIIEKYNKENDSNWDLEKDGLFIKTTLNYTLQKYAIESFKSHLKVKQKILRAQYDKGPSKSSLNEMIDNVVSKNDLQNQEDQYKKLELFNWDETRTDSISIRDSIAFHLTQLHAGMMGMNPNDGAIKVWVGGVDYSRFPFDQIYAKRQMASSFKPILYAAALEEGFLPCDYLDNDEMVFEDHDNWSPQNYDNSSGGNYSLQGALINSKNIPTVNLYFDVGFDNLDYLWEKMEFSSSLYDAPSTSLGTATASIYEMTRAYGSFANGGKLVEPWSIESITTADGDVLYSHSNDSEYKQVITENSAELMSAMMQKAVQTGTGVAVASTYGMTKPLAGKTGTSQNYSDAWFASYTPELVLVTRVGASSPNIHFNSGAHGSGSRLALPLVALTLKKAQNDNNLSKKVFADFSELSKEQTELLNCDDFVEDGFLEDLLEGIKAKETNTKKKSKKSNRRKRKTEKEEKEPFFKRIFKRKK